MIFLDSVQIVKEHSQQVVAQHVRLGREVGRAEDLVDDRLVSVSGKSEEDF